MSVVKLFRTGFQVGEMSLEAQLLEMDDAKDAQTLRQALSRPFLLFICCVLCISHYFTLHHGRKLWFLQ